MKHTWNLLDENERINLTFFQFSSLLISTLKQRLTQEKLVHGFHNSGVFPLDKETLKTLSVKEEVRVATSKVDADKALVAMSSLLGFLPKSKVETFEATLQGRGKVNKSDETLFGYFCHLKQLLVDSKGGPSRISSPIQPSAEDIKIEPDLIMNEVVSVAVKMEREEDLESFDVKIENIFS